MNAPILGLRSPADQVGGLVYFGRMIDKIRLHHAGKLPADYQPNLGHGFDERCIRFLRISYPDLVDHVTAGNDSDESILEWALNEGRHPEEDEYEIWNEFLRKRGMKDAVSATVEKRKASSGLGDRADIETFFQFIDADEGRL